MSKRVVTGTFVSLDATDRSSLISNAELAMESDTVESTTMGSSGWREFLAGLKSWSVTINFRKDADLSVIDDDMWTAFDGGTNVAFIIRGTSASASASNAQYSGNILINQWTPINGEAGSLFEASYTFQGTGAVTRATS